MDFLYNPTWFHPYRHQDYSAQQRLLCWQSGSNFLRQYFFALILSFGGSHLSKTYHYVSEDTM
nr:MAG TPA: hypothetical protein [Caudoviricetes sp.]